MFLSKISSVKLNEENKKNILDFLLIRYEEDDKISVDVLKELKDAVNEMESAQSLFNNTDDPILIEAAIYKEEAAKENQKKILKNTF